MNTEALSLGMSGAGEMQITGPASEHAWSGCRHWYAPQQCNSAIPISRLGQAALRGIAAKISFPFPAARVHHLLVDRIHYTV